MVSLISTRLFFVISCTFKRPSLRLFRFKILQFVPTLHIFDRFCGFSIQKGTNCAISNISNRRLGRLKVHNKKKSCTDGGQPTKKLTSLFKKYQFSPFRHQFSQFRHQRPYKHSIQAAKHSIRAAKPTIKPSSHTI